MDYGVGERLVIVLYFAFARLFQDSDLLALAVVPLVVETNVDVMQCDVVGCADGVTRRGLRDAMVLRSASRTLCNECHRLNCREPLQVCGGTSDKEGGD
ncbi:MAG: hypothetical protein R3B13_18875 [Polyangiaceae bacterium]